MGHSVKPLQPCCAVSVEVLTVAIIVAVVVIVIQCGLPKESFLYHP